MSDESTLSADGFAADDAAGLTDAELRGLLEQARRTGDEPLRRLVASYIMLRTLAAEMVTLIETREGAATVVRTPIFSRLAHLTRRRQR